MNVGSILNADVPPNGDSSNGPTSEHKEREDSVPIQRHSIVSLLNDTEPKKEESKGHDVSYDSQTEKAPIRNDISRPQHVRDDVNDGKDKTVDKEVKSSSNGNPMGTSREGYNGTEHESEKDNVIKKGSDFTNGSDNSSTGRLYSSRKPKRYSSPPIWAREWYADKSLTSRVDENDGNGRNNGFASTLSNKHVFDRTATVGTDLECSITGIIPASSVTRTIAEWIYANFNEISDENRKYVELELKFGTIIDKKHSHRINIDVSTECIYTNTSNIYFDMGVHEVGWREMSRFLDELERNYQDELRKGGPASAVMPKRKFNVLESDITDMFYQIMNRNEQPKSIRVSKDNTLKPPRYSAINKQRLSDLYIHNPSSMYDLRLSLSLELPVPENEVDTIVRKNTPSYSRIKQRNSWSHRPTVSRFDLTKVLIPKEMKGKSGKSAPENEQSFEVELEIDTLELFNGFDKFKSGVDSIRFEELVEIFVNNARCLNNRVTKLASH